jgi:hypothetical protein
MPAFASSAISISPSVIQLPTFFTTSGAISPVASTFISRRLLSLILSLSFAKWLRRLCSGSPGLHAVHPLLDKTRSSVCVSLTSTTQSSRCLPAETGIPKRMQPYREPPPGRYCQIRLPGQKQGLELQALLRRWPRGYRISETSWSDRCEEVKTLDCFHHGLC